MTIKQRLDEQWQRYGDDSAPDWEHVVNIMDETITEQVHSECSPCTQREFFKRYCKLDKGFEDITQW